MEIIADVARLGNRNAITDACVAMMAARSAVLGALLNVRINLASLKDTAFVDELKRKPAVWSNWPVRGRKNYLKLSTKN